LDDFQKSIQDLAKIELDEVFAFKIDKKSKNELKEHIEQIKLHQDSMSSETEMRGNLNKKRLEAQKALDAIIAKEEA
jgi:hypothetical protein